MSAGADPPPRCPLGCAAARFLLVRRRLDFACALLRALLGAEEDGGTFDVHLQHYFSGGFLVQLFASVQYILHALHRPNPMNHSFFAFDVHLQHYFSTLCHSPCPMLNHSSHGAIFAENHMSFPCMAAPSFELFACGGR